MRQTVLASIAALVVVTITLSSHHGFSASPNGDPSLDGVLKYVEPHYNGMADGESVVVEVEISADGKVDKATVIHGTRVRFVNHWMMEAAWQWRFDPASIDSSRKRRITFTLDSVRTDSPRGVRATYENPLTLHVEYVKPTVFFLQRVNGHIPIKYCEVHHELMTVERLPIHYGLRFYTENEAKKLEGYWEARKRKFPHAPRSIAMGCTVGSEVEAEAYVCASCVKAKAEWIASHPNDAVEPD